MMDIFYCIIIILFALVLPATFLRDGDVKYRAALRNLIIYHLLFSVFFYFFTRNGGGDSWGYWLNSKGMRYSDFIHSATVERGTYFMEAFNYIPAAVLDMGFFANTLLYGLLGAIGLCCFFVVALRLVPYNTFVGGFKVFPLIFYLPNLHFWSAGLGKDTLLFMCIGLFAFAMLKPGKRLLILILALALSYAVRPHVTLILLASFGATYIFSSNMALYRRVFFLVIMGGISTYLLPQVMDFVKLDDISIASISQRGESQAAGLQQGSGSAVDINSYPLPLKIITFLYRPLFFDAHNITMLLASIENLILIYLTYLVIKRYPLKAFRSAPFIIQGMMILLLLASFLFSQTLGNLGIMVRMKNMFMPGLLLYIMWALSFQNYYRPKR